MRRISRSRAISWYTIPFNLPCDICGKKGEYYLNIRMFWLDKGTVLCSECRRKWIKGDINL